MRNLEPQYIIDVGAGIIVVAILATMMSIMMLMNRLRDFGITSNKRQYIPEYSANVRFDFLIYFIWAWSARYKDLSDTTTTRIVFLIRGITLLDGIVFISIPVFLGYQN